MALRGAVYVNGIIKPAGEAVVPVYDHGFLYGEGVYETIRTYNRTPFLYDRHMDRLRASAARIHLDVPFSDAELATWIDDTVQAAGAATNSEMQEAYIRILSTQIGMQESCSTATPATRAAGPTCPTGRSKAATLTSVGFDNSV